MELPSSIDRGASRSSLRLLLLLGAAAQFPGCARPEITAEPLSVWNQHEGEGIPFYLPKPLLIVSKNFRYVEESKVGLTGTAPIPNTFDDQGKYADLNARTSFDLPQGTGGDGETGATTGEAGSATASEPHLHSSLGPPVAPLDAPGDGLAPETFFTYQIVFVPDLTQKYGLKVKGGAGEMRAALNLVNGWQFTGLGPYYMKDSSTAQNILASGIFANLAASGAADVIRRVADLGVRGGTSEEAFEALKELSRVQRVDRKFNAAVPPGLLCNYAEIHVLEPFVTPEGFMEWREIAAYHFDREYLGASDTTVKFGPKEAGEAVRELQVVPPPAPAQNGEAAPPKGQQPLAPPQSGIDGGLMREIVRDAIGLPPGAAAVEAAAEAEVPSGGPLHQVNVNYGDVEQETEGGHGPFGHKSWWPFHHRPEERPRIETRRVVGPPPAAFGTTHRPVEKPNSRIDPGKRPAGRDAD